MSATPRTHCQEPPERSDLQANIYATNSLFLPVWAEGGLEEAPRNLGRLNPEKGAGAKPEVKGPEKVVSETRSPCLSPWAGAQGLPE